MSRRRIGATALVATLVLLAFVSYLRDDPSGARAPRGGPPAASSPSSLPSPDGVGHDRPATERAEASPSTVRLGDPDLEAQVRRVISSFDRTGRPPQGVAQGGRRGGARGVFENAEGRLPREAPGYYRESDVWPRGPGGRGAERLIFGRQGEVYYTADHYRSFVRVR